MRAAGRKNIVQFVIGAIRHRITASKWFNQLPQQVQSTMRFVVTDIVERRSFFGFRKQYNAIGYISTKNGDVDFSVPLDIGHITIR